MPGAKNEFKVCALKCQSIRVSLSASSAAVCAARLEASNSQSANMIANFKIHTK